MNIFFLQKLRSGLLALLLLLPLVACYEPGEHGKPPSSPPIPKYWPDGTPIADNYPRDHYGVPYYIGDLGGQPVNLAAYSMDMFVEYEDSPGFDREKLRDYKPPVRTYHDVITAFTFYMNYTDGTIYDSWSPDGNKWYQERRRPGTPWIRVGIRSGSYYPKYGYIYDAFLESNLNDHTHPPHYIPLYAYVKTDEMRFGLEVYANPGINPQNGIAWRNNWGADDVFVYRDGSGHVISYIKCSNNPVPKPPCDHRFLMKGDDMKAEIRLLYDRQNLVHWQRIEMQAERAVRGFIAQPMAASGADSIKESTFLTSQ